MFFGDLGGLAELQIVSPHKAQHRDRHWMTLEILWQRNPEMELCPGGTPTQGDLEGGGGGQDLGVHVQRLL